MNIEEARELIQSPIWTHVRDHFLASGAFEVFPAGDLHRLAYLDAETQASIAAWRTALEHVDEWRKVVDGETVRKLKATILAPIRRFFGIRRISPSSAGRSAMKR